MRARPKQESDVVSEIRIALAKAGVLIWRNHVSVTKQESGHFARSGLATGSADLIGLVPPSGRFIAIECKRPKGGRVTERQRSWLEVVRECGGVAGVARSVDEAMLLVEEARRPSRLEEE